MLKKIFLINPLVYTIIILGITFGIQFFSGARLAYFVVDVVDSGREEACKYGCAGSEMGEYPVDCYYYGGCWNMVNEVDITYMESIILIFLLFSAAILPFLSGNRVAYTFGGLMCSYVLYTSVKGLDWFYNCQDFCGFENFYIFPFLFIFIFSISFFLNKFWIKKKLD